MEEKHIWFSALVLFVLTGLFPPWEHAYAQSFYFTGWSAIGSAPDTTSCINLRHLFVEWALIWGVAGVLIYLKRKNML
jgi:hypothetical protein